LNETIASPAKTGAIRVTGINEPKGFAFGFRQRCALVAVEIDASAELGGLESRFGQIEQTAGLLAAAAGILPGAAEQADSRAVLLLSVLARAFQQEASFTIVNAARVIQRDRVTDAGGNGGYRYLIALPAQIPQVAGRCFALFAEIAGALLADPSATSLSEAHRAAFEAMAARMRQFSEGLVQQQRIVKSILTVGMPFQNLASDALQIGWGSKSRLLSSNLNDGTSALSVTLARSKLESTAFLRSSGLPTPRNQAVESEEAAVTAANEIGYPVVVKPSNLDRGKGASANLHTDDNVRQAYRKAREFSPSIMVEEHVAGTEHRLMVLDGRLFWAFKRVPAHVVGDGTASIRELIEAVNLTREEKPVYAPHKIAIDEDLLEVLGRSGRSPDTVPQAGEHVRLRDTALSKTGGQMIAAMDEVHPDNAELAIRATRMLRLNFCGVDYLTTDITKSWRDTGGRITELNAGPEFARSTKADLYEVYLRELLGSNGRIPVAMVIGSETGVIEDELRTRTRGRTAKIGIAGAQSITIGPTIVHNGAHDPWFAARALSTDMSVDAMVLFADGNTLSASGLPFDKIDLLAIVGEAVQPAVANQLLSVVGQNVKSVVVQGDPGEARRLAQRHDVPVQAAASEAPVTRAVLAILPRS
jgi:cyanophycin synthetase